MKVTASQIWEHLLHPKNTQNTLIFGPQATILENLGYDFLLTWAHKFAQTYKVYSTLHDYLTEHQNNSQVSLFGKAPSTATLFLIRGVTDKNLAQLKELWDTPYTQHTLICIGENLTTRSKIVTTTQNHKSVLAIGFYEGSVKWRMRWIDHYATLSQYKLNPSLQSLLANNTDDATELRDLVHKVALLNPAHPDDLRLLLADHQRTLDDVIWKFFDRSRHSAHDIKCFVAQNSDDEMKLVRSLISMCLKLYYTANEYQKTGDLELSLQVLEAPLNFKVKPHFTRTLQSWKPQQLWHCLGLLNEAEYQLKSQGRPLAWSLLNLTPA